MHEIILFSSQISGPSSSSCPRQLHYVDSYLWKKRLVRREAVGPGGIGGHFHCSWKESTVRVPVGAREVLAAGQKEGGSLVGEDSRPSGAAAVSGTGRESARPAGRVRWSRVRIRAAELSGLAPASLVSRVAPLFRASFSLLLLPPELVRRMGRGPVSPRSPWGGSQRRSQHLSLVATFGQVCI